MKFSLLRLVCTLAVCVVTTASGQGNAVGDGQLPPEARRENLGRTVNSIYNDFAPVISPDGQTLFFCRSNHPKNVGGGRQDIWFAKRQPDGTWGDAVNIGAPLNNREHNSLQSVSPDGNMVLVMDNYGEPDGRQRSVALSMRTPTGWSEPKPLNIRNFYHTGTNKEFFLSNDGNVLVMAITRHDSRGGNDLYVSFKTSDDEWSEPQNLGESVNSAGHEDTPFIASDGQSLYFSSNGKGGYGSFDVYVSRRLDTTWTAWSEPVNLGPAINTAGADQYYTLPARGDYAYYVSSDRTFGEGDIFKIILPETVRPRPVALIYGKVLNKKTLEPIEADIVYEILASGKNVGTARSTPVTGDYKIILPAGENYGFLASAPGFVSVSDNIDLTSITEYTEIERNLYLVPIEQGQKLALNNIFFDYNKASLRKESQSELNRVAAIMEKQRSMTIEIGGHTDDRGSDEYNERLSGARAKSVMDYIVSRGVDASRLRFKGYGEQQPVESNETEEGRQKNRRVEITILTP